MIDEKWLRREKTTLDELKAGFAMPDKAYAPYAFWFWIDKNPQAAQYGAEAREMAAQGLSGGYVQDRGFCDHRDSRYFEGTRDFQAGRYFECFDAALEETKRAGLSMGYCEPACIFGTPEMIEGQRELRAVSLRCRRIHLKRGESAVVPDAQFTVVAERHADGLIDSRTLRLAEAGERVAADERDETLFVFTPYTARTSEGSCNNYLQHEMADRAMRLIHEPILERYKSELGETISGHFFDLEGDYGYKLCWSRDLEAEYERRTGRDLRLMCPLLLEKDGEGRWMRARYDWFDAVSEVYARVMFGITSRRLAEYGLYFTGHLWEERLLGQALLAGDPMRVYRAMSMTGVDHLFCDPWNTRTYKEAQSVAELDGKRFMCELLGCAGWETTPLDMRRAVNNALAMSVSNIVPHGVYSDRERIENAHYAPDFFDWQPAWQWTRDFADYMRRGSFVVSQGRMDADTLLYNPLESVWALLGDGAFDEEPSFENTYVYDRKNLPDCFEYGRTIEEIDHAYTDAIERLTDLRVGFLIADRHYIRAFRLEGGRLRHGAYAFDTVVLPPIYILPRDVMEKLLAFAGQGGRVIYLGALPEASAEEGADDAMMRALSERLRTHPNAVDARDGLERHIGELNVMADWLEGGFRLRMQRRTIGGHKVYWLCNNDTVSHEGLLRLNGAHGRAVCWNLENGTRRDAVSRDSETGALAPLKMAAGEGFFLEFDAERAPMEREAEKPMRLPVELPAVWRVYVDEARQCRPTGFEKPIPERMKRGVESALCDWAQLGLGDFSGVVSYETAFELPACAERLTVDLGEVRCMAKVSLDGGAEQSLFWGPYRAEFQNVSAGRHTLRVRVGNLLINRLRSAVESGRGRWHRWAPSEADYRNGLFGPVILEYEKREEHE